MITAERAIEVLLLFSEDHSVVSAAEVGERLKMPRSTTYRYLQSLRSTGLIEEDPARGGFRLGPLVLRLGRIARATQSLSEAVLPAMRDLACETGETVLLTRRSGAQVVCLERIESTYPLRISYEPGHALPLHAGASATVLLAWADPAEVERLLEKTRLVRFTSATLTSKRELRRRLAQIRSQGYAVSFGEVDEGAVGIAAPLFGPGDVEGAISVVAPAFRLPGSAIDATARSLLRATARASAELQRLA